MNIDTNLQHLDSSPKCNKPDPEEFQRAAIALVDAANHYLAIVHHQVKSLDNDDNYDGGYTTRVDSVVDLVQACIKYLVSDSMLNTIWARGKALAEESDVFAKASDEYDLALLTLSMTWSAAEPHLARVYTDPWMIDALDNNMKPES